MKTNVKRKTGTQKKKKSKYKSLCIVIGLNNRLYGPFKNETQAQAWINNKALYSLYRITWTQEPSLKSRKVNSIYIDYEPKGSPY